MPVIDIPKHAIATHPIRKTVDGVSRYTPIFVKFNMNSSEEKELAKLLGSLAGSTHYPEIRVFDKELLCYSFEGAVKEVRQDGVLVLEVKSEAVRYPREA